MISENKIVKSSFVGCRMFTKFAFNYKICYYSLGTKDNRKILVMTIQFKTFSLLWCYDFFVFLTSNLFLLIRGLTIWGAQVLNANSARLCCLLTNPKESPVCR